MSRITMLVVFSSPLYLEDKQNNSNVSLLPSSELQLLDAAQVFCWLTPHRVLIIRESLGLVLVQSAFGVTSTWRVVTAAGGGTL